MKVQIFLEKAGGEVLDYGLKELKRSGGQIVKAGLGAVMRGEGLEGALEAVEKRSRSELKRVARSAAKDAVSYAGKELKSLTQKNVGEINSELSGIAVEISMLKNLRSGNGGWLPDQYREKLKALEEERDYLESKLDWASIGNKAFKGVVNVGEKLARSAIEDELGFEEEEDDDLLGSLLGGW